MLHRGRNCCNCVLSFLGVWPVSCLGPRPSGDKVYAPPFYVDTWSLEPSLGCCMLRTTIGLPLWDFNGCLPSQCQGVRPRFWTPLDSNTSRHNIRANIEKFSRLMLIPLSPNSGRSDPSIDAQAWFLQHFATFRFQHAVLHGVGICCRLSSRA